jgi:hypothetical protein
MMKEEVKRERKEESEEGSEGKTERRKNKSGFSNLISQVFLTAKERGEHK